MSSKERMVGLDSLRFIMVILVIALHAGMTYMDYGVAWWYVSDPTKSLGFTYLVVILDYFPMTVMFFLAGYFAPPSLAKRGVNSFIHDKFMHIGIPWILGVLLVAPFFSRASMIALGQPSTPIYTYIVNSFFGPAYQQAHYWFLGILFLFLLLYGIFGSKKEELKTYKEKQIPPIIMISLVAILTCITYYLSVRFYKPVGDWTNIGYVLYFQPARFIGYIGMFILGVYGNRHYWFKKEGWKPNPILCVPIMLISIFCLAYWKFTLAHTFPESLNQIIDAVIYSITSIGMTFGLISIFIKIKPEIQKPITFFTPYSYGIYWLHQIVLMGIMAQLVTFNFSAFTKWSVSVILTLVICTLLARYVLKKTPFLRNIF